MNAYWKGYTVVLVFPIPEFSRDVSRVYTIRTGKTKQTQSPHCSLNSELLLSKFFFEIFFRSVDILHIDVFIESFKAKEIPLPASLLT